MSEGGGRAFITYSRRTHGLMESSRDKSLASRAWKIRSNPRNRCFRTNDPLLSYATARATFAKPFRGCFECRSSPRPPSSEYEGVFFFLFLSSSFIEANFPSKQIPHLVLCPLEKLINDANIEVSSCEQVQGEEEYFGFLFLERMLLISL